MQVDELAHAPFSLASSVRFHPNTEVRQQQLDGGAWPRVVGVALLDAWVFSRYFYIRFQRAGG